MKKKKASKYHKKASPRKSETNTKSEVNPFELRINRQKHAVLGQKLKNDKGHPGISRHKAVKKRVEIFQKSSLLTKKSNSFIDKRIGEYDDSIPKEDLLIERMTLARKKKYKRNIYNLNDEEPLTHYGQSIMEIEKFDMPNDDSEDDDDELLDAGFVDKAHFGGFLTKKDESSTTKTHKEILGDLILENKRKKEEKKAEKNLNDDLTEKLDKEWKQVLSVVSELKKMDESNTKNDAYDLAVRELQFERRGKAANLVKTKEELEKAERAKLEKLEEERRLRMQEDYGREKPKEHNWEISADSIYDGLAIENEFEITTEASDSEENASNSGDKIVPLDIDEESEDSNPEKQEGKLSANDEQVEEQIDTVTNDEKIKLVGSYTCPLTVEQLSNILLGKSSLETSAIVENIIVESHPSRGADKVKLLEKFFKVLLTFIVEKCLNSNLQTIDALVTHLYTLTKFSAVEMGKSFRLFMLEKFSGDQKTFFNSPNYPSLDILILLKLCGVLYPTSDFHHPIITPAMLYICNILTNRYKMTLQNILSRIFLSCLFYEYVAFSKRLVTEPMSFLYSVLYLASEEPPKSYSLMPKHILKYKSFLAIESSVDMEPTKLCLELLKPPFEFGNEEATKVSIIYSSIIQLHKFAQLYQDNPAFQELFEPAQILLECLPVQLYPTKLTDAIASLKAFLSEKKVCRSYLSFPRKKPRLLKLLEPNFEMNMKDKNMTFEKKLRIEKQLSQKIRKAEKGLIREMRRDSQFIAMQQHQEIMTADAERKRKVKELYHLLSEQEGEYKKFAKKK